MVSLPATRARPLGNAASFPVSPPHESLRLRAALRELHLLRVAIIASASALLLAAWSWLAPPLPWLRAAAILAALTAFAAWSCVRMRAANAVGDRDVLVQLAVDLLAVTGLLALTGGASNPLAGMLVLPLTLGAVWLTPRSAWALAAAGLACGALLVWAAQPLTLAEFDAGAASGWAVRLAIQCIPAAVVAFVLLRILRATAREHGALEAARRRAAADDRVERIGSFAAGAAHDLNAPLASIAMIVDELRRERPGAAELDHRLDLVARQADQCRETLRALLSCARGGTTCECVGCDAFVRECLESFRVRRPESAVALHLESEGCAPAMLASRALRHALINVLDNAADVCPQSIEVSLSWEAQWVHVRVRDHGPGICGEILDVLGRMVITTKAPGNGNGLGLYLASHAVAQFGGSLVLANAEGRGAVVEITLPVCTGGQ